MTDGMEGFQERVARIKAAAPEKLLAGEPTLAPEQMADLGTLPRNSAAPSFSDYANELFDTPAVRHGLPLVIAVLGFAAVSALVPTDTYQVMVRDETYLVQAGAVAPFNTSDIANELVDPFVDFANDVETLEGAYILTK